IVGDAAGERSQRLDALAVLDLELELVPALLGLALAGDVSANAAETDEAQMRIDDRLAAERDMTERAAAACGAEAERPERLAAVHRGGVLGPVPEIRFDVLGNLGEAAAQPRRSIEAE